MPFAQTPLPELFMSDTVSWSLSLSYNSSRQFPFNPHPTPHWCGLVCVDLPINVHIK